MKNSIKLLIIRHKKQCLSFLIIGFFFSRIINEISNQDVNSIYDVIHNIFSQDRPINLVSYISLVLIIILVFIPKRLTDQLSITIGPHYKCPRPWMVITGIAIYNIDQCTMSIPYVFHNRGDALHNIYVKLLYTSKIGIMSSSIGREENTAKRKIGNIGNKISVEYETPLMRIGETQYILDPILFKKSYFTDSGKFFVDKVHFLVRGENNNPMDFNYWLIAVTSENMYTLEKKLPIIARKLISEFDQIHIVDAIISCLFKKPYVLNALLIQPDYIIRDKMAYHYAIEKATYHVAEIGLLFRPKFLIARLICKLFNIRVKNTPKGDSIHIINCRKINLKI